MRTRPLTAWELSGPPVHDYIVFRINPVRMDVSDATRLAQKIEDTINLDLERDAVRVDVRVRNY